MDQRVSAHHWGGDAFANKKANKEKQLSSFWFQLTLYGNYFYNAISFFKIIKLFIYFLISEC